MCLFKTENNPQQMYDSFLHLKKVLHVSIHRSAQTSEPLTGEMNNIDHLFTMQSSVGESQNWKRFKYSESIFIDILVIWQH